MGISSRMLHFLNTVFSFQVCDQLQLRVLECTPPLTRLGASLEEAERMRNAHFDVLQKIQVTKFLLYQIFIFKRLFFPFSRHDLFPSHTLPLKISSPTNRFIFGLFRLSSIVVGYTPTTHAMLLPHFPPLFFLPPPFPLYFFSHHPVRSGISGFLRTAPIVNC